MKLALRPKFWPLGQTFGISVGLGHVTLVLASKRCPAVGDGAIYIQRYINSNVFSCVLKVVRPQSDIHNAAGKLFHTEGP